MTEVARVLIQAQLGFQPSSSSSQSPPYMEGSSEILCGRQQTTDMATRLPFPASTVASINQIFFEKDHISILNFLQS